jgi:hypothetical protein
MQEYTFSDRIAKNEIISDMMNKNRIYNEFSLIYYLIKAYSYSSMYSNFPIRISSIIFRNLFFIEYASSTIYT